MNKAKPDLEALKAKAESGDVDAQLKLGHHYLWGYLVEKDLGEALKWYLMAADQGDMKGQYESASIIETSHADSVSEMERAFELYYESGEQNYMEAQYKLGEIFQNGLKLRSYRPYNIVRINYLEAFLWYKKAAEQNHELAMYKLGLLLGAGKGTTKNAKKAFSYILKAACRGVIAAMSEVSKLYNSGTGVKKNYYEAYIWALLAKANDHNLLDSVFEQELEQKLNQQELEAAQDEADLRFSNLEDDFLREEKLYKYLMDKLNKKDASATTEAEEQQTSETAKAEQSTPTKAEPEKKPSLLAWNVSDIGKVIIHLNEKDKTIVVRYGRNSARFGFTELFSPSGLRLLVDFDKHARDPHEPAIAYLGNSINQAWNLTRNNQKVVSDFNKQFRDYFGLAKTVKAFTWLPGTKVRRQDKSLKIHFQLKVNYRV